MNLPNKLTILRIALVPICLILVALGQMLPAAIVFAIAAITDTMDGRIARKYHLVTNFGKFADPIADKVLTLTMMIVMSAWKLLPVWVPCIVAIRELMVDGLRLIAMEKGKVVPAGLSGKIKTVAQMVMILWALVFYEENIVLFMSVIVCALTIYSGAEYFWQLRDLFSGDFKG